jgi:hypothetical protein
MTYTFRMSTPTCSTVERRAGLTREQFVNDFQRAGRPVVFTDLTKDWPALGKFSPDYFRKNCGNRSVPIGNRSYKLAEFLDLLEQSTPERPAPYPCKLDLHGDYADLAVDVPRPSLASPDRTRSKLIPSRFRAGSADLEVFIGGPGGEFPYIHYDYLGYYAFINQIHGEKEFFVYPPGQEEFLYPDPERRWLSKVDNAFKPNLDKFPLFAKAKPAVLTLGPGESLFIPAGAWHTARSKTVSISVAFDQLSTTNWDFYVDELVRLYYPDGWKKAAVRGYLGTVNLLLSIIRS